MPVIAGQAAGQILNNPGGLMPGGRIVNENANQLINQSGYTPLNKFQSVPDFTEVEGYSEKFSNSDGEAIRFFKGAWPSRGKFIQTMLGYSTNNNGTLSRVLPDNHPEMPWLWATDYELIKGEGAPGTATSGLIAYYNSDPTQPYLGQAHVKIIYRRPPYEIRSDADAAQALVPELSRWLTRDEDYAVQNLPLPGGVNLLKFVGTNTPIANGAGTKIFPTKEVIYTWHDVPDVPDVAIDATVGKVNDATFDNGVLINGAPINGYGPFGDGYAAGTLLCMAPKKRRQTSCTGRVTWTITYRFLYRPTGWNKFPSLNQATGQVTFSLATYNGLANGGTLYDTADFTDLFTQPNPATVYVGNGF